MTVQVYSWPRPVLRVLVLALAVAAAPLPALAGDVQHPAPQASALRTSIQQAAATAHLNASNGSAQQGTGAASSPTFFRTPIGIGVLAVLVAGAGYAVYSTSHDRIHSAGKK